MPTGVYQADAGCPFYRYDDGKKHRITCEGIVADGSITLFFMHKADYKAHITGCCCGCWQKCGVYKMLMEKYEEDKI